MPAGRRWRDVWGTGGVCGEVGECKNGGGHTHPVGHHSHDGERGGGGTTRGARWCFTGKNTLRRPNGLLRCDCAQSRNHPYGGQGKSPRTHFHSRLASVLALRHVNVRVFAVGRSAAAIHKARPQKNAERTWGAARRWGITTTHCDAHTGHASTGAGARAHTYTHTASHTHTHTHPHLAAPECDDSTAALAHATASANSRSVAAASARPSSMGTGQPPAGAAGGVGDQGSATPHAVSRPPRVASTMVTGADRSSTLTVSEGLHGGAHTHDWHTHTHARTHARTHTQKRTGRGQHGGARPGGDTQARGPCGEVGGGEGMGDRAPAAPVPSSTERPPRSRATGHSRGGEGH